MRRIALSLTALAMAAAAISPAHAQSVRNYRVEANSEFWVNLSICSPNVNIEARGDGDTDVDFTVYNPRGAVVFQDLDGTDFTGFNLRGPASGCQTYRLKLSNLGDVWNMVRVTVTDL